MLAHVRREDGLGLPEVLVAILIVGVGLAGSFAAFTATRTATVSAQRTETAVHVAQQQIEGLRAIPYPSLKLTSFPGSSAVANDPRSRIVASAQPTYRWNAGGDTELLATQSNVSWLYNSPNNRRELELTLSSTAAVDPGPIVGGSNPDVPAGFRVYRFVTLRNASPDCDNCAYNSKRLVVAVTPGDPATPGSGPRKPVWASTVVSDPAAF